MSAKADRGEHHLRSLSELEALVVYAVRGFGCPWGIAEDTARSIRVLAENGLPGPEHLARWLDGSKCEQSGDHRGCCCAEASGGPPTSACCPVTTTCPLRASANLCDRHRDLTHEGAIQLGDCIFALLMVGSAARVAEATGQTFRVSWQGFVADCEPHVISVRQDTGLDRQVCDVIFERCDREPKSDGNKRHLGPCAIATEALSVLERFAARTRVPATAESRASGAGAGLTDQD